MKCMNLKCDSEEFNMGHSYSLTDPEEEEYFWVGCDECETEGPACKTAEEAKSYFEDQPVEYAPKLNNGLTIRYWDEIDPRVEDSSKWSDEKATPLEDIKKFSEDVRNETLTVFKTQEECIESMRPFTPMFREGEKLEDFRQRVMDRIAQSVPIPTEVLNMEFNSKYSAYRETLIIAKIRSICQMARGAAVGASLEAFAKRLKDDDLQSENGEMAMVDKKSFRIVPIDKKGETIPLPMVDPIPLMETYIPKGMGIPMEGFKGKLLGIPFDMSKEREIKIPKPLPPGPTQIADSPVPVIADSPTPAINLESFSYKCNCGSKAEVTATTIKCTNPECYHYEE